MLTSVLPTDPARMVLQYRHKHKNRHNVVGKGQDKQTPT